jgi:3-oxoacyl-[acyl-carrier protein] reductase
MNSGAQSVQAPEKPDQQPIRWALVTGASRGIGAAIAKALAEAGYALLINYRSNVDAAQRVKEEIEARGGQARLLRFDVADAEPAAKSIQALLEEGLRIDVVINNAGIAQDAPFPSMTLEQWRTVTRTSLDGFYHVTQPLVMPMVHRRWGRIITISSISGLVGNRGQANYSAAKAGLIGATRSLARELAKRRITVNAVAPGLIETEMVSGAPLDLLIKEIPMRRLGKPEEVAHLVRFLVSEEAAYITGQVISINGGLI